MRNPAELLQQTEDLLNRGKIAEALGVIAQVKQQCVQDDAGDARASEPSKPAAEGRALPNRIDDLRSEIFGAMAMVFVTQESIDPDHDYDRRRALGDVYERLDAVAAALDEIAGDVRRAVSVISDALLVSP